jgi:FixJ family two-component response regulator
MAENPGPVLYIVDDDKAVRESVSVLAGTIGLNVREAETLADLESKYDHERPGCVLLDLRIPGLSGLPALEHLRGQGIGTPVIFFSAYADARFVARAMKQGAFDFFEKPFAPQELLESIQTAIDADIEQRRSGAHRREMQARLEGLSPRERAVVTRVAQGETVTRIAAEEGLSRKTVEKYRREGLEKLRLQPGRESELIQLGLLR